MKKQDTQEKIQKNDEDVKPSESYLQLVGSGSFFFSFSNVSSDDVTVMCQHLKTALV